MLGRSENDRRSVGGEQDPGQREWVCVCVYSQYQFESPLPPLLRFGDTQVNFLRAELGFPFFYPVLQDKWVLVALAPRR